METEAGADKLKHTLLERLLHYFYFVSERQNAAKTDTVTSSMIADALHMDDTLVRKDLASIGVRGHPRVGFKATEVLPAIRHVLGFDETIRAVIIGTGRLGGAMASYKGFAGYGLDICALFDCDPNKSGMVVGGLIVQPMEQLAEVVRKRDVRIAILAVPVEAAQDVADLAVATGVKAIWNFASTSLSMPEGVFVRHEHIAVGLAELTLHLRRASRESP